MRKEQVLINHIQEYIDSGKWEYEACYLNKTDLEVIIKALEQKPKTGMNEIIDVIHKTIYQFVCNDEEAPLSDKVELLLKVNKAICDNLEALEQEPFMNKLLK